MCLVHGAYTLHLHQINDVDVNLLSNRGSVEGVFYGVVLWPLPAVYIQIPEKIYSTCRCQ